MNNFDTISALATPYGKSAISVIRVSGDKSIEIVDSLFFNPKGEKVLRDSESHRAHFGKLILEGDIIDECICLVFRSPNSYTGEDSVEISIHGSKYIQDKTLNALILKGVRMANEGEFTKRAFLNGKLDLSQAEAVADVINSNSEKSHQLAFKQLRGGYSEKLKFLRTKLLNLSSLLELELDFSEEDVEFADRTQLKQLIENIKTEVKALVDTFSIGNAFKNGVPISIIGKPNVGKSTLLNALVKEDRAIVSDIAGTTRDTIEESIIIKGVEFRFTDTAGLRHSSDNIEIKGIQRTYKTANQSRIIFYMVDASTLDIEEIKSELIDFENNTNLDNKELILIINKYDKSIITREEIEENLRELKEFNPVYISAKLNQNLDGLIDKILSLVNISEIGNQVVLTNQRHFEAMIRVLESIDSIEKSLEENIPSDLIAIDVNSALHYIGTITGHITSEEILSNIFSQFCIGK